jgi:uncharacterized membrane protein
MGAKQIAVAMSAALGFSVVFTAGAQPAEEGEVAKPAEDVEEVEEVEPDVGSTGEEEGFTFSKIAGRQHAAAVHLPIGLLAALCLIELLALIRPKLDLGKSGLVISVAVAFSLVPAAVSGLIRSAEVFADREPPEILFEHRNLMIGMAVVFTASLALRIIKRDRLEGAARWVHLALLLLAFFLVVMGGHHGGQMVYGEGFLPY